MNEAMTGLAKDESGSVLRTNLEPLPPQMRGLPVARGYPVPWFVAWVGGKPEFRAVYAGRAEHAIKDRLCWVCGQKLGRRMTFVIGPMCGINRTTAEPPCHPGCAEWSARNCPFLSNESARRRVDEAINDETLKDSAPGIALTRNPGVSLLWTVDRYSVFEAGNGRLIDVGMPLKVEFFANGRLATRAEVVQSVESGLPTLMGMAEQDGPAAVKELTQRKAWFESKYPA